MSADENKREDDNKTANEPASSYSTNNLDINFLPQIYDIIRCLEKETQESSTPKSLILVREQPSDYSAKMNKLKESFEKFRQQVPYVPGSNQSKEEQLQTLRSLRQQLIMKKELLLKYKNSSLLENINTHQQHYQQFHHQPLGNLKQP